MAGKSAVMLVLVLGACSRSESDAVRKRFCVSVSDTLGDAGVRHELEDAIKALESESGPARCATYRLAIRSAKMMIYGFNRGTLAFERPYVTKVFDALRVDHGTYVSGPVQELGELEDRCTDRAEQIVGATRDETVKAVQTVIARVDAAIAACPSR